MNGACDEVGELKAEIEKLKEECYTKKELSEFLKKSNAELLLKSKEANNLIEQKSFELDAKNEELSQVRQICENLKSSLEEKDLSLRHLNFVNEKFRDEYSEKVKSLEEQNKGLVVALDEATVKIQHGDRNLCAGVEEIRGLKRLLSIAEKKCLEADEKTKASNELKCRDDIILEVEEENRKIKDQLKWKSEQFEHLEEAHGLLQNEFHQSKIEWEREKSDLLKDLYSLKTSLDSQIGISEDLCSQLKICNQALSHEESKRKMLEIEVVELRSHFDNVVLEFEEAKSKVEKLTLLRDEDIAELRSELGTKEALNKEMRYKIAHLELENNELQELLKECREEQIKLAGGVSVRKLETKLKRLEQLHGQCSLNIKKKEAEWNSRYEKMMEVVNGNISDLKSKDLEIEELQKRLECCHYLMEFLSENEKVMLCDKTEMDERSATPKEDYGIHIGVCDELLKCQVRLKEHFEQMETTLRSSSEDVVYALELANGELAKKINEVNQTKLELQVWRSNTKVVQNHLQENQDILEREKDSLVRLVKDQDEKLNNFEKQIVLSDAEIAAKMEEIKALELEKQHYYQVAENKDFDIREFKNEIHRLKQESVEREREGSNQARLDAEKIFKQEEERLLKVIKEKDQGFADLCRWVMLAEQDFERDLLCSFSAITEYQTKLDILIEAIEKAEKLKQLENNAIRELENEKQDLFQELTSLRKSLFHSSSEMAKLEADFESQRSETEEVKIQLLNRQAYVLELQKEKDNLSVEVMNRYSQREDMIAQLEAACDWIGDLCQKDAKLTNTLEKILLETKNNYGQVLYSTCDESTETCLSPSTKSERERSTQRSPLKALNH